MKKLSDSENHFIKINNLSKKFSNITAVAGIDLAIQEGEFFSLLGPSGCGKTTTLRLIAGLEKPDTGSIVIRGKEVNGNIFVPPENREIGVVFQDYALFPHMTVMENVSFGIKKANNKKFLAMEMLQLVGLANAVSRYPHELSGGQQQRVALARALAPSPDLILLDEPFSNLDAELRNDLRLQTKEILKTKKTTAILVTHDQEEAFSLSNRIAVFHRGKIEQIGIPEEIYKHPHSKFVASFVGRADFIPAIIQGKMAITPLGKLPLKQNFPEGSRVDLFIRPDSISFAKNKNGNCTIVETFFLGPEILYKIKIPGGLFIHAMQPSTKIWSERTKVSIKFDASCVTAFQ